MVLVGPIVDTNLGLACLDVETVSLLTFEPVIPILGTGSVDRYASRCISMGMSLSLLISARADGSFGQSYQATCLPSFVSLVSMR